MKENQDDNRNIEIVDLYFSKDDFFAAFARMDKDQGMNQNIENNHFHL